MQLVLDTEQGPLQTNDHHTPYSYGLTIYHSNYRHEVWPESYSTPLNFGVGLRYSEKIGQTKIYQNPADKDIHIMLIIAYQTYLFLSEDSPDSRY